MTKVIINDVVVQMMRRAGM